MIAQNRGAPRAKGAEAAGRGPGLSRWQPAGQSRAGFWKLLGGREEKKGTKAAPGGRGLG